MVPFLLEKSVPLVLALCAIPFCLAQEKAPEKNPIHEKELPKAKLLLLGTFHFKDAGLDGYKPKHDADILSEKRQKEVEEVTTFLKKFKPTKVAVEAKPEHREKLDERYAQYLKGEWSLTSNEIYQLGFRLAKAMGHPRVYPVDAPGRWFEQRPDSEAFAKTHGQTGVLESPWYERYERLFAQEDLLKTQQSLRETLLLMNSEKEILHGHGIYLIGTKIGDGKEFPGVDGFVTQWYNRNLRIFSNLQRLVESPEERILLIIGAGHLPILRHAAQASPEFDLVEVHQFLATR